MGRPNGRARRRVGAVLVLALFAAGCSNMSGTVAQRVQQWAANAPFGADSAQLQSDLTSLGAGLRLHDLKGLHTECAGFSDDVSTLYTTLPTPDPPTTDDLNTALVAWANAASSCTAAASFTSPQFATYRRDLATGSRAYAAAKKRLARFGVR